MLKKKIFYESMPFNHFKIVKDLAAQYKQSKFYSQPNYIYIESDDEITLPSLTNMKTEEWSQDGMFYDECYCVINSLIEPYDVINKEILHKLTCLNTNPKLIVFNYNEIQCNFNLIHPLVLSVMTDQLIFFTSDYKCLFICDQSCNPSLQNIYNVLRGRLFDRFFALQNDLENNLENNIDFDLMNICEKITPPHLNKQTINLLCQYCYYDQYSKTVNEDILLMGTVSALKFKNQDLRHIHTKENSSQEVECVRAAIALSKFIKYGLPKGNLDPFGLKKSADCVVEYTLKYGLVLPEFSSEVLQFLNKRLKNSLTNSYMEYAKEINWLTIHQDKNVYFNIDQLLRIYKLYNKNKNQITQNISLTDEEQRLMNLISNMSYTQINSVLENLTKYVDNNRIADYTERMQIITTFVEYVLRIFDISGIQQIRFKYKNQ